MKINTLLASPSNYSRGRDKHIKYIVIHYTANNGDTAKGNCQFFSKAGRNASAHYFVDEYGVYQSVLDSNTAWSVGARLYTHKECRNNNSLSIELCSRIGSDGKYFFKEATISNAAALAKYLMGKYRISIENVLRHYDVTSKNCPEPFVRDPNKWTEFKRRLEEEEMNKSMLNVQVNGSAKKLEGFIVDGVSYAPVRDLCNLVDVKVGYDKATKTIILSK